MNPPVLSPVPSEHVPHLIPAWMVPLLALPIRRIWDKPSQTVLPLIQAGAKILEVGPGSGFFTIPMAQAAGPTGAIACVELQEPVRRRLEAKLQKRGLHWVKVRPCSDRDLQVDDLVGAMDLAVAIDVLHEIPDPPRAILAMARCLRPGGRLLVLEPKGHCKESVFQAEVGWAEQCGLLRQPALANLPSGRHGALFLREG